MRSNLIASLNQLEYPPYLHMTPTNRQAKLLTKWSPDIEDNFLWGPGRRTPY